MDRPWFLIVALEIVEINVITEKIVICVHLYEIESFGAIDKVRVIVNFFISRYETN